MAATYRIEIVNEETDEVLQSAAGIPEARIQAILRLLGRVGAVVSEVRTAQEEVARAVDGMRAMQSVFNRTLGRYRR